MQVSWNISANESPIIFQKQAEWSSVLTVKRARVADGELHETAPETHEITVTLAGNLTTRRQASNGKRRLQESGAGNFCLNAAGQFLSARWRNNFEYLMINLDPAHFERFARENDFRGKAEFTESVPPGNKRSDPLIEHIGLALISAASVNNNGEVAGGSDSRAGRLYFDSLAQTLMLHLLKNYTATPETSFADYRGGLPAYKLRRVEEFVRENLDRDLTLAEMAEAANLSQYHFARAFRQTTGITPHEFLMRKRIEFAKDLLAHSNLPIVEISHRAGFKNQSHFTNLFRKLNALTPKVWREIKHA
jgi:AraC family transcriptional regulator